MDLHGGGEGGFVSHDYACDDCSSTINADSLGSSVPALDLLSATRCKEVASTVICGMVLWF